MNQVMLISTDIQLNKVTKSGPYEQQFIEDWVKHARKANSEGIVKWEIIKE